jgi:GT2 family glycosyltransferase
MKDSGEQFDSRSPLVSVVVPTYNRRSELEITVKSLLDQSYPNFEVLVCDDSSTDSTFEFLQELQLTSPRLRIFRNERNLNFNGTLQRLFSLATGEFIGMQHDHDIYNPEFLTRMVSLLQSHPSAGFACASYHLLSADGLMIKNPPLPGCEIFQNGILNGKQLLKTLAYARYTPIAAMSTVFRRSIFEAAGGYQTDWYLASDEDLYRRTATISDIAFCPERIFVMRLRPTERQKILGSWKNIYTLFLFRMSVADTLNGIPGASPTWAKCRQYFLKWKAMIEEGLSLWLRGELEQVKLATDLEKLPRLPTTRPALTGFERLMTGLFVALLTLSIGLGPRLNRLRKRA